MSIPAHRLSGLALAVVLHLAGVLLLTSSASWLASEESGPQVAEQATPVEARKAASPETGPAPEEPPASATDGEELDDHLPRVESAEAFGFQFDLRKIRARWNRLFPFVMAPPSFEPVARVELASRLVFADPPAIAPSLPPAQPPLSMSDAAMQRLIDRTWSRRERWAPFEELTRLIAASHPSDGRLPRVIREYVEQNGLQPYAEATLPDPRRWTLLKLAADHQDFIDFAGPWIREHPHTRTGTELLFLMDALARGSRESLVVLLETSPTRDMARTRAESPEAWTLFAGLREHYGKALDERGLGSIDLVRARYDEVRLQLLGTVLRLTPNGYRAGDARLLMGKIQWRQGNQREAVRLWREMTIGRDDSYGATAAAILGVLRDAAGADAVDAARIDAILDAEQQRWVATQFDRLRRFGYGFYTY